MFSESENSIVLIEDAKVKRRSSIFRPDIEPSQRFNDLTMTTFPVNYAHRLIEEKNKWKETYNAIVLETEELKKKANENTSYAVQLSNLPLFDTYVKKAEEFCHQINNVVELHENLINYQTIRKQELRREVEITSEKLHEELIPN